jgi:periplasmic protein TonB
MAEAKSTPAYRDMLDIIFADRNRAYGAYQLRRSYPKYMGRALAYGMGLIILFFLFPYIMPKVSGVLIEDKPIEVVFDHGPPPDIDPNNPPPPPPPPTRSTIQFVPPIVKKDDDVAEKDPPTVEEVIETKADVGKETKKGTDDAPPSDINNPSELIVEAPSRPVEEKTYEMFDIQKPPSFPGGEAELLKFLAENIKYPPLARENNIQGSVVLSFVIGKKGEVTDVAIVKDIGGGCGKEAVRVVQNMPKWSPGEAAGNPVKVRFMLPVRFKLE